METTGHSYPVTKTDDQWRTELDAGEYHVLREAGTEPPFTSPIEDDETDAVYACRACGTELFSSDAKFDARCGWPAFWQPVADGRIEYLEDRSFGHTRTEVRCANCGSHLGHVFEGEGHPTPTDQRYCINGICLVQQPTSA